MTDRAAVNECRMRQQYPFDFAWCETHDTTFSLGEICEFNLAAYGKPEDATHD